MKIFLIHLSITVVCGFILHEQLAVHFSGIAEFCIYILVMLLLWLLSFFYSRNYFRQFWGGIVLYFFFTKELFMANLRMIKYILMPGHQFRPAILELPLTLTSERGIVLLANLITLTPGTLTLEISEDKEFLYFHSVNVPANDPEKAKEKIKHGFEKYIMKITG